MADRVSDDLWRAANVNGQLEERLLAVGQRTAERAKAISRREGGKANYTVVHSIRPGGRAQVQVMSDNAGEEYGDEKAKRIGALRRAARGER